MGYSTDFYGRIEITPALNKSEVEYLQLFAETRHMIREQGEYYVDGTYGQDETGVNTKLGHHNRPPASQPSLWCNFTADADGTALEWTGSEKTQCGDEWIEYLINHFLKPDALASKSGLDYFKDFTFDHVCNGQMLAQGEDIQDRWKIIVTDNEVTTIDLE